MAINVVGSAYVKINADTSGISKQIQKGLSGAKSGASGQTVGKNLGKNLISGLNETDKDFQKAAKELGADFEKHFITSLFKGNLGNSMANFHKNMELAMNPKSEIGKAAEGARQQFLQLSTSGAKIVPIMTAVAGSIADLVGGLSSMVLGAAVATPSIVAFGGALTDAGLGLALAKIGMSGVTKAAGTLWQSQTALNDSFREASQQYIDIKFQAEGAALAQQGAALALQNAKTALIRAQDLPQNSQAYQQALLSYKQANLNYSQSIHKTQEATRAVAKGITATAAYQPFAALSASQLQFVKFLVSLRPMFQDVRKQVSNGFIPYLEKGISTLVKKDFPLLKDGFVDIAYGAGHFVREAFKVFDDPKNIKNLNLIFKEASKNLTIFGNAFRNIMSAAISILAAAQPMLTVFTKWIEKVSQNLNDKFQNNNSLRDFFANAGIVAAKLGDIIGNVASILGSFIKANAGPGSGGQLLLDWIRDVSGHFASFLNTAKGANSAFNFFGSTATNFKIMAQTIGKFVGPLMQLAGSPQLREMWASIGSAAPYFKQVVTGAMQATPELGKFIAAVIRLFSAFFDGATSVAFFKTLTAVIGELADLMNNKLVRGAMAALAPIVGIGLAIHALSGMANFAASAVVGHFSFIGRSVKGLNTGLASTAAQMKAMAAGQRLTKAGALVQFNQKAGRWQNVNAVPGQPGRPFIAAKDVRGVNTFSQTASKGFGAVGTAGKNMFSIIGNGFKVLGNVLKANWILLLIGVLVLAFMHLYNTNKKFAASINSIMKPAMKTLGNAFGSIMKALHPLMDLFFGSKGLVNQLMTALIPVFQLVAQIISWLVSVIIPPLVSIIDIVIGYVELLVNNFLTLGTVIKDVLTGNWGNIGNDIAAGFKKANGIIQNTAGSVVGAFTGNNGSSGGSGGSGGSENGSSVDGSAVADNAAKKVAGSWQDINKKQIDAANMQYDAAKTQYEAALSNSKNNPDNPKAKADLAIATAAKNITQNAKIANSSAISQMIHYGRTGDTAKSSSIDKAISTALQNYKGYNSDAVHLEGARYNDYKGQLSIYQASIDKYNAAKSAAEADPTNKKKIQAAASAQIEAQRVKPLMDALIASAKTQFGNISIDKNGKVTIHPKGAGGSTSTSTGSGATDSNAGTGNSSTNKNAPTASSGIGSGIGRGSTASSAISKFDGSLTSPYIAKLLDKSNVPVDWAAIRKTLNTISSTDTNINTESTKTSGYLYTLIGLQRQMITLATQSAIRDNAYYESQIANENKGKIKAGSVTIGGKTYSQGDFNTLSTSVTGIRGVAGFNN